MKTLSRLVRLNLTYLILVILWGAYVRATGSGAGCGEHWPLCNGQVIPREAQTQTIVEFTHRLMSGLSLLLMSAMTWMAFRVRPRGDLIRKAAMTSLVFLVIEALIGAGLVLFSLVAQNESLARAIAMGLHLVNTLLLLAALTWTLWLVEGRPSPRYLEALRHPMLRRRAALALASAACFCIVGLSGAIAALGDTLFPGTPAGTLPTAGHLLLNLRIFHPLLAALTSMLIVLFAREAWSRDSDEQNSSARLAWVMTGGVFLQMVLGVINVVLLAPIWMQIVHLLVADLLWIALIVLGFSLTTEADPRETFEPALKPVQVPELNRT